MGGYYNITEWVTPGYARLTSRTQYGSVLRNQSYQFIVQPQINTVSSHTGGTAGQAINVSGTGFSTDSSKIQVQVPGMPCALKTSTEYQATCEISGHINIINADGSIFQ